MPFNKFLSLRILMPIIFLFSLAHTSAAVAQDKSTLSVEISGLHSDIGKVCIRLWNKKDGFPTDDKRAYRLATVEIAHGTAKAVIPDVPFGTYAISTWHDENANGKFDTRFPGIPLEGYGISNGTRGKLGPPPFQPSVFSVTQQQVSVPIRILY